MKDIQHILGRLEKSHNMRALREVSASGKYIMSDGRSFLNMASNDYLGIASDTAFQREFFEGLDTDAAFLMSSGSSRLMTGNGADYQELESTLSRMYDGRSVLTLGSGYLVNTGVLPAVVAKGDLIIADKAVHASIIDGLKLAGCAHERYRHNDMNHLEALLEKSSGKYGQVWVVTESVFSMDGDTAPLREIADLKSRYGFKLYLDEAHAFGLYGHEGAGLASRDIPDCDIDILIATFGKAAASYGAFVVSDEVTRKFLINIMRTLIYSTALAPIQLKWTDAVVRKIPAMKAEREHLAKLAAILCPPRAVQTPIVPLMAYENERAGMLADRLRDEGYWALPIRHPTVPEGSARIRISLTAAMTVDEITDFKTVCERIGL